MLRDVLTALPGVATWPCDEINYIWRHGNVRHPSDEFTADMARPEVCRYIRRQFDSVSRRNSAHSVVEKTCANSLRVPFVDRVVPEAKYLFIHRDALDAVGSAMKRWKAGLDIPYLVRKARFVPISDLPYYAFRYLRNRVHRVFSNEKRLAFWGPQLNGMQDLLQQHSLEEVCALQWKRCVDLSAAGFRQMPDDKVCTVSYEQFVREPEAEMHRICRFLNIEAPAAEIAHAVSDVSDRSVGKGRQELGDERVRLIEPLIRDTRQKTGYA